MLVYFKYPKLNAGVVSERKDVYMYSMFLDLRIYNEQHNSWIDICVSPTFTMKTVIQITNNLETWILQTFSHIS